MRLAQIAAHADDLDRAAAFWSQVLGAEPAGRFDPPGLLFFDLDGTRLLLEGGAPPATLYLQVDDAGQTLERLRDLAEVVAEPHRIFVHENDSLGPAGTEEWQAFVRDPEGNLVGLVSHRPT